jgi:hypothetical protein
VKTQGQYENQEKSRGRKRMKRLLALIIVWTLLVITGTLVSADAETSAGAAADGKQAVAGVITDVTSK